jgi:hypothetical protein
MEWSGVGWSGVGWGGVEWNGMEWREKARENRYVKMMLSLRV